MEEIQWFKSGDKKWLRNFAESHGITFKQLATEIFPNTPIPTLQGLWQRRHAAGSSYADALLWYAKAKRKNWEWLVNTNN